MKAKLKKRIQNVGLSSAIAVSLISSSCILPNLARAENEDILAQVKMGSGPVVFFVSGFGGFSISTDLQNKLKKASISVYNLNWNDVYRKRPKADIDDIFINQMVNEVIPSVPSNRPIVIIGHSFGGDSVLQVANETNRKIDLLAVLDGVGTGGERTRQPVNSNVVHFYNRWTKNSTLMASGQDTLGSIFGVPLNASSSGEVKCSAQKRCDQKEQSIARESDGSSIEFEQHCSPLSRNLLSDLGVLELYCGIPNKNIDHAGDRAIHNDKGIQKDLFDLIVKIPAGDPAATSSNPQTNPTVSLEVLKQNHGFFRREGDSKVFHFYPGNKFCWVGDLRWYDNPPVTQIPADLPLNAEGEESYNNPCITNNIKDDTNSGRIDTKLAILHGLISWQDAQFECPYMSEEDKNIVRTKVSGASQFCNFNLEALKQNHGFFRREGDSKVFHFYPGNKFCWVGDLRWYDNPPVTQIPADLPLNAEGEESYNNPCITNNIKDDTNSGRIDTKLAILHGLISWQDAQFECPYMSEEDKNIVRTKVSGASQFCR